MGNRDVSKTNNDGERELLDRAVKALEAELATKTCNKQIASKLEDAELARDSEETCNNKQVSCKLVASEDCISRQAVLDIVDSYSESRSNVEDVTQDMISDILALPSVTPKQEPCEDAVSFGVFEQVMWERDVAIDQLKELGYGFGEKQRTGHWVMPVQDDGMSDPIYYQVRCSKCGFDLDPQTWNMELHKYGADKYCPKCGAKMVEPQERSNE